MRESEQCSSVECASYVWICVCVSLPDSFSLLSSHLVAASGSYQDLVGQGTCKTCESGRYCPYNSTHAVNGTVCADMPSATASFGCPRGHYCRENSTQPQPCWPGSYQPADNSSTCEVCPSASYCPNNGTLWVGTYMALPCPAGHFCVSGSQVPAVCAPASYQPSPSQSACLSCPGT